jgi:hypothetical protein
VRADGHGVSNLPRPGHVSPEWLSQWEATKRNAPLIAEHLETVVRDLHASQRRQRLLTLPLVFLVSLLAGFGLLSLLLGRP